MPSSRRPSRRRSRESGTRRSRSSRGRRHGDGHSLGSAHWNFKQHERNFPAAVCNMLTIVILCVALAEPRWFSIYNGLCSLIHRSRLHYLGAFQFFYSGHFIDPGIYPDEGSSVLYQYGAATLDVMSNCVTTKAVLVFKWVIACTCMSVVLSFMAFLFNLSGPTHRTFKMLHRNAIFSILSVVICVITNILCYFITTEVHLLQGDNKKAEVSFDVSFYLVSAAGSISVLGVACNCLRRYPQNSEITGHQYLLDDCDDLQSLVTSPGSPHGHDMFHGHMPPPPAYTPSAVAPSRSATTPTAVPTSSPSIASQSLVV